MKITALVILFLCLSLPFSHLTACSIPVFQYAMERWPPDYYQAVLLHQGPLESREVNLLKKFQQTNGTETELTNIWIQKIDLESSDVKEVEKSLNIKVPEKLPVIAFWYPGEKGYTKPLWIGEFNASTIAQVIESPVRQKIIHRLIEGDPGVWVFLESGNQDKDNIAYQLLEQQLEKTFRELKEIASTAIDGYWGFQGPFECSIIRFSRSDPREIFLLQMLLNSEPDLHSYPGEPVIFPIFGRGRVLFSLVSEGINPYNIHETIAFLTGPCGCQFKAMNPGVDLLLNANWYQALGDSYGWDTPLPDLTGVFPETSNTQMAVDSAESKIETQENHNRSVLKTTTKMMGLILVLAIFGSLVFLHLSRRQV
jgi:hypothetical protein